MPLTNDLTIVILYCMKWTPTEIKAFRKQLNLNQTDFAKLLGVDARSVARWEAGTSHPTGAAEAILTGLREKIRKDPDTLDTILEIIGTAIAVGGLAYLLVKLFDYVTERGSDV